MKNKEMLKRYLVDWCGVRLLLMSVNLLSQHNKKLLTRLKIQWTTLSKLNHSIRNCGAVSMLKHSS